MPLIRRKINLELDWIKDCILSSPGDPVYWKSYQKYLLFLQK